MSIHTPSIRTRITSAGRMAPFIMPRGGSRFPGMLALPCLSRMFGRMSSVNSRTFPARSKDLMDRSGATNSGGSRKAPSRAVRSGSKVATTEPGRCRKAESAAALRVALGG